jgi:hypothetical protein
MSESSSSKGKTGGWGVGGEGGEGESEEITTTPYRSSILRLPEMGGFCEALGSRSGWGECSAGAGEPRTLLTMPCGVGMAAKANCKLATVLPATCHVARGRWRPKNGKVKLQMTSVRRGWLGCPELGWRSAKR